MSANFAISWAFPTSIVIYDLNTKYALLLTSHIGYTANSITHFDVYPPVLTFTASVSRAVYIASAYIKL